MKILSIGIVVLLLVFAEGYSIPISSGPSTTSPTSLSGTQPTGLPSSASSGSTASSSSNVTLPVPSYTGYGPPTPANFVLPYVTYSWGNYGYCNALISTNCGPDSLDDQYVQSGYMNIGNEVFAQMQGSLSQWGAGANTSRGNNGQPTVIPDVSVPGYTYSTQAADIITKYQIPYFMGDVLDGYGGAGAINAGGNWVNYVTQQFPDMMDYDATGQPINVAWMQAHNEGFVRVDTLSFPTQLYNDLVNIKNNIMSTGNPNYIKDWWGIQIAQPSADNGAYGAPMWGNQSILDFAQSPQCSGPDCAILINDVQNRLANTATMQALIVSNDYGNWNTWTNLEFLLGYSYALYLFQTHYGGLIGHMMVLYPSNSYFAPPSQYPYPYNTPAIESLNLLQAYEIDVKSSVYGGSWTPDAASIARDTSDCKMVSPYGNTGVFGALAFVSTGGPNPSSSQEQVTADVAPYYIASCTPYAVVNLGQFVPQPSSVGWPILSSFGQILDRMRNVGNTPYQTPALTRSDASTGVSLTGGNGMPLLVWLYTNKSSPEAVSMTLSASTYQISPSGWIALSVQNWNVIASGSTNSISLTNVPIGARSWNPVYIVSKPSAFGVVYSNLVVSGSAKTSQSLTYDMAGPHRLSSWLVTSSPMTPLSVTSTNTGTIPPASSLGALNNTFVGMRWTGGTWQNITQTGWYYDSHNGLLYVHYVGDNTVGVTVNYDPGASTTTTTSTTQSTNSTTTSTVATNSTTVTSTTSTSPSAGSTTSAISPTRTVTTSSSSATTASTTTEQEQAISSNSTVSSTTTVTASPPPLNTIPPSGFSRDVTNSVSQTTQVTFVGGQQGSGPRGQSSPPSSAPSGGSTIVIVFGALAGALALTISGAARMRSYKRRR